MKYSSALDGLRGIAVILVILFHCRYLRIGWVGVQLFYVLSGYLITTILLESKKNEIFSYLKNFYIRRSLRIFPLYFLFVFLLFIGNKFYSIPLFDDKLMWLVTYTYNIKRMFIGENISLWYTHLWSLAVEEQFYLIWPFIIYLVSGNKIKYVLLAIIISAPLLRYAIVYFAADYHDKSFWLGSLVYNFTLTQADAFSYGAILTQLDIQQINKLRRLFIPITSIAILVALLVQFNQLQNSNTLTLFNITGLSMGSPEGLVSNYYKHVWGYSIINIISMLFIAYAISNNKNRLLNNNGFVYTGKISYGLYVYHCPLLAFMKLYTSTTYSLYFVLIYCTALFTISITSYKYFELPFLKLKNRFSYN